MAQEMYVGVGGKARKIIKAYVGVNDVAREITAAYVGVSSKARQFYTSTRQLGTPEITSLVGTTVSFSKVENAMEYDFYIDGAYKGSQAVGYLSSGASTYGYDLATASWWNTWFNSASTGSHTLRIRVNAAGYESSELSDGYSLILYSVTITNYTATSTVSGASKVVRYAAYTCQFSIQDYYNFTTPTVTIGGTTWTPSSNQWNSSTGKLTIPSGSVTGNITISIMGTPATYTVANSMTNATFSGNSIATYSSSYTATITANNGYRVTTATKPTVYRAGVAYTGATWSLNSTSVGKLAIPGSDITGTLRIVYSAVVEYKVTYSLTGCTTSGPSAVGADANVTITFNRTTGYVWGSTKPIITSKVGMSAASTDITGQCTWSVSSTTANTATLTIPSSSMTGDLSVSLALVKQTFSITKTKSGCLIEGSSTATYGEKLDLTVTPYTGYSVAQDLILLVVKVGSTTLTTAQYSYDYDSITGGYILSIPANLVTGAISITLNAVFLSMTAGTWKFNSTLDFTKLTSDLAENINFTTYNDGDKLSVIQITSSNYGGSIGYGLLFWTNSTNRLLVYYSNKWNYSDSQEIVLTSAQTVTEQFYRWAIADGNLTKIS